MVWTPVKYVRPTTWFWLILRSLYQDVTTLHVSRVEYSNLIGSNNCKAISVPMSKVLDLYPFWTAINYIGTWRPIIFSMYPKYIVPFLSHDPEMYKAHQLVCLAWTIISVSSW